MNILKNKKILLIVCGGISAYKSLELIRLLKKKEVEIKTILTRKFKKIYYTTVCCFSNSK